MTRGFAVFRKLQFIKNFLKMAVEMYKKQELTTEGTELHGGKDD